MDDNTASLQPMDWISDADSPVCVEGNVSCERFGFILLPEFSMIAYASAVEALKHINYVTDSPFYAVSCYAEAQSITASNGLSVNNLTPMNDARGLNYAVVCGGLNIRDYATPMLLKTLRRLASCGVNIGAISTGSYILARAGLLNDSTATIHWENISAFKEEFPHLDIVQQLYVIDNNRFTCSGGIASMDMILNMATKRVGAAASAAAADQLVHPRIREGEESQRMFLNQRLGITHSKLIMVIGIMEENLENPLSCRSLANSVNLSTRQLERLFNKYLQQTPIRYYQKIRLEQARGLLLQTSKAILDIALACGFVSSSHFSKCFREFYHLTPSDVRKSLHRSHMEQPATNALV